MRDSTFDLNNESNKKIYSFIFILSFFLGVTLFLPYVIQDKGYFYYLGDYNCQQIPFNMLAHKAVRSGDIFWNWNTDLGANFIGSYAFYAIGSPFFWLSVLLPDFLVPMALPWLLVLKFAFSAVTSYAFISRFVKNKNYALFSALTYAFSSFAVYNIFFNHFNEMMVLFPLILIGLEELMEKDRKGLFALALFINAFCNYYFFVAEVVFLIIYFFIRLYFRAWPDFDFKKLMCLAFESAVGFGLAAVIVFPAVLTTMQIPRASSHLSGWALITYFEVQRYPQLLQAYFFPPEVPSQPNFYPESGGKWSSVSAWLPLFSMTGVFAWISRVRKDWLAYLIITLSFMLFIPPLNASFQLLSNNFYTRWLFMLVLMMALATAKALEKCSDKAFKGGLVKTAVISAALSLPVGLVMNPDTNKIGLEKYPERLWSYVAVIAICLVAVYVLIFKIKRQSKYFNGAALVLLCVVIIGYGNLYIFTGRTVGIGDAVAYTERNVKGREKINLPDIDNVRIDTVNCEENAGMFWGIQTIQAFHSVVPGSIMEFYPEVGVTRDVASRPDASHLALRPFLSVKYLFDGNNSETIALTGFKKIDVQNECGIWENENYIPMGFTYDKYISRTEWNELEKASRENMLLKAIVLEDSDVDKYKDLLTPIEITNKSIISKSNIEQDSEERRKTTATDFKRDKYGFEANISLQSDDLVFFSVPNEPGWTAEVNGEKVDIVKANVGFMAVKCKAGESHIRFNYMTPGLFTGLTVSGVCLVLLLVYLFLLPRIFKKKEIEIRNEELGVRNEE